MPSQDTAAFIYISSFIENRLVNFIMDAGKSDISTKTYASNGATFDRCN